MIVFNWHEFNHKCHKCNQTDGKATAEWTYQQSTGNLSHNGKHVATGYSGKGVGKNNPAKERVKFVGPIPRGTYSIGPAYHDPTRGPVVMRLTPTGGQDIFGRDGFLIHGDSSKHPGEARVACRSSRPRGDRGSLTSSPPHPLVPPMTHQKNNFLNIC